VQPPAASPVPASDLVVVAASAGGLSVLHTLVAGLPVDFPAAVAVVHHRTVKHSELLPRLLARRTPLRVVDAEAGSAIIAGTIYVAPPDKHLTITPARTLALLGGVTIKHLRSAADPLFISAAAAFGSHVAAVVMSGYDSDGSDGARAVRLAGGVVFAQSPPTADVPSMPMSAIATGAVDLVVEPEAMAAALLLWVMRSVVPGRRDRATVPPSRDRRAETASGIARGQR
jgi:two-component system, chemotaxis family, protein-glutamate methylesterase/glutaminase